MSLITLPHAIFLYDEDGNPVPVVSGSAITSGSRGFIVFGEDGNGETRQFKVDADGKLAIQDPANLDVALSTRLSEATFTASVNTLGQKTMAGSTPVVIASDQSVVSIDDNGGSLTIDNAFIDANISDLVTEATFTSSINTLGQKTMAGSTPVVLASNQTSIPVTDNGGSLTIDNSFIDANISDLVTEATFTSSVGEVQATPTANTVLGRLKDINDTNSTLLTELEFETRIGEVQATPTTNTVLGRLKDINDTNSTLLTEADFDSRVNTLGQKTMTGSTPVVLASDQTVIPVSDNGGSLTVDNSFIDANLSTLVTEATFTGSVGEVQASPTANTVLGRLKDIHDTSLTLLTELEFETRLGEVQATPTVNTVLGRLKDINDTASTLLTELEFETRIGEVQATPTANTVLGRLKDIHDTTLTLLTELEFETRLGEVQATPTANTVLGRLKDIHDTSLTLLTELDFDARIGEVQATPTANTVLGRLKDINDTNSTLVTEATFTSSVGEVSETPTDNTVLGRLKDLDDHLSSSLGFLGQKTMDASTPVVIASDQTSVLVESVVSDHSGSFANIVTNGTRTALSIEYPALLWEMKQITRELKIIRQHMEAITEEEWDGDC